MTPASLGPKNSREFRIPIKFAKQYGSQTCQSGTTHEGRIVARGWRKWPANDLAIRQSGASSAHDRLLGSPETFHTPRASKGIRRLNATGPCPTPLTQTR